MKTRLRLTCPNGCGDITVASDSAHLTRCKCTDTYAATYRCPRCAVVGTANFDSAAAARCVAAGLTIGDAPTTPLAEVDLAAEITALDAVHTIADIGW